MSQRSTTSSFFSPISDSGENDSNNTPSSSLDKAVGAVKALQLDADILKRSVCTIHDALNVLDRFVFNGKRNLIVNIKSLEQTILNISNNIQSNATILSPIPGMAYANRRKQTEERRSVSPDTVDTVNNEKKKRRLPTRLKTPPPKRLKVNKDTEIVYDPPSNFNE